MAFRELVEKIGSSTEYGWPVGASNRYKRLDAFERLLRGTIYHHLPYPFDLESDKSRNYVPILNRRPSARYGLAMIIANQHASMVFGEQHFPHIRCVKPNKKQSKAQKRTEDACTALIVECKLMAIMQEAVRTGSIGSAAFVAKIRANKRPCIEVISGKQAKPVIEDEIDYENIPGLNRIWDIDGEGLRDFGYEVKKEDLNKTFWLRIYIDATRWTWYLPLSAERYRRLGEKDDQNQIVSWQEDPDRSGSHGFDEVPAIWLRNFVVGSDSLDGVCTYDEAVADDCIAIDYLLSQSCRGLRYSMDPLLVIQMGEMGAASLDLARGGNTSGDIPRTKGVLPLEGAGADAKLLEITGGGFEQAQELFKKLREAALEMCGGIISGQETKEGPESGRAIELHQILSAFFSEMLRTSYGNAGLVPLLNLLLRALKTGKIDLGDGEDYSSIDLETPLSLTWPQLRLPTGTDLLAELQAMQFAAGGSTSAPVPLLEPLLVSRLTAQKLDLDDPASIADEAQKYRDEQEKKQLAQAQQDHSNALEMASVKTKVAPGSGPPKGSS